MLQLGMILSNPSVVVFLLLGGGREAGGGGCEWYKAGQEAGCELGRLFKGESTRWFLMESSGLNVLMCAVLPEVSVLCCWTQV